MNLLKNVYDGLRYDLTRNYWLRKSKDSIFYGHVLMFHHVTNDYVDINASCQCKVDEFKKILTNYKEAEYEFVSVEKALRYVDEKEERRFVVVTFDDIPENVYTNAYTILKEMAIPFTIFVSIKFIDRSPDGITKRHLLEMSKDPLCTVGAHTMTHPLLREASNSEWEISQSRVELEQIIGKRVTCFAYPFGRYSAVSKKIIDDVKNAGYDYAFCTIDAPLTVASSTCRFFLPRIVPESSQVKQFRVEWTFHKIIRSFLAISISRAIKTLKE